MCHNYIPNPTMPNAARMQRIPTQPAPPAQPMRTGQRPFWDSCADAYPFNPQYIQLTPDGIPVEAAAEDQARLDLVAYDSPPPESPVRREYIPEYLRAHIGDLVRVEFLMCDSMTDRVGILSEVGASYIVLKSPDGASSMMCDLYSIKFVTFLRKDCVDCAGSQMIVTSSLSFKG